MKVTFVKKGPRRYAVEVRRDRYPDLWCGSIGYDDRLPHDLLHFVAEAEYGLDGGVFGDLAAGGNARIFQSFDPKLTAKMWRKQRIHRTRLPDGRRSEQLAGELEQRWRARTLEPVCNGSWTTWRSAGRRCRWAARSPSSGRGRKDQSITRQASAGAPPPRAASDRPGRASVDGCPHAHAVPA